MAWGGVASGGAAPCDTAHPGKYRSPGEHRWSSNALVIKYFEVDSRFEINKNIDHDEGYKKSLKEGSKAHDVYKE